MSYCTWHNYGYGICTDDIVEHNVARLRTLLERAPEYHAEIQSWFAGKNIAAPTWDDYMDLDEDFELGLATLLKEVINEAEGIELTACDDYDCTKYLLYQPCYPWQLTDKSRVLTEEDVRQIFHRYVGILTDTPVEIDYQSVENGG